MVHGQARGTRTWSAHRHGRPRRGDADREAAGDQVHPGPLGQAAGRGLQGHVLHCVHGQGLHLLHPRQASRQAQHPPCWYATDGWQAATFPLKEVDPDNSANYWPYRGYTKAELLRTIRGWRRRAYTHLTGRSINWLAAELWRDAKWVTLLSTGFLSQRGGDHRQPLSQLRAGPAAVQVL